MSEEGTWEGLEGRIGRMYLCFNYNELKWIGIFSFSGSFFLILILISLHSFTYLGNITDTSSFQPLSFFINQTPFSVECLPSSNQVGLSGAKQYISQDTKFPVLTQNFKQMRRKAGHTTRHCLYFFYIHAYMCINKLLFSFFLLFKIDFFPHVI